MTLNGTRISMQFVVLFFIVHIIVNFDLLIAMLLNNCCKIIVSSCNLTIDMHIHGKVSKKSAFFFCKSESSTDWTNWLSFWRLRYSLHYAMPLCTYPDVPRCGYTFYTLLCKQKMLLIFDLDVCQDSTKFD